MARLPPQDLLREQGWMEAALRAAASVATSPRDLRGLRWQVFHSSRSASLSTSPVATLSAYEDLLRDAGPALGVVKATPGVIRRALLDAGRRDLARSFGALQAGRRWAAHPDRDLPRDILGALLEKPDTSPDEALCECLVEFANTFTMSVASVGKLSWLPKPSLIQAGIMPSKVHTSGKVTIETSADLDLPSASEHHPGMIGTPLELELRRYLLSCPMSDLRMCSAHRQLSTKGSQHTLAKRILDQMLEPYDTSWSSSS